MFSIPLLTNHSPVRRISNYTVSYVRRKISEDFNTVPGYDLINVLNYTTEGLWYGSMRERRTSSKECRLFLSVDTIRK